jgi:hypothetical protein
MNVSVATMVCGCEGRLAEDKDYGRASAGRSGRSIYPLHFDVDQPALALAVGEAVHYHCFG